MHKFNVTHIEKKLKKLHPDLKFKELFEEHELYTIKQIADILNVSIYKLYYYLIYAKEFDGETRFEEVYNFIFMGLTIEDISQIYNISQNTLRSFMRRNGLVDLYKFKKAEKEYLRPFLNYNRLDKRKNKW